MPRVGHVTLARVWSHDGVYHRLDRADLSIQVSEDNPPKFDEPVNVWVSVGGERYSASFFTPEQVRQVLNRWKTTSESLPGDVLGVPDLVIVGALSLESIEQAVRFCVEEGLPQSGFVRLSDGEA